MNSKYLLLLSFCISILISSCSYDNEEILPQPELSIYQQDVIEYFKEIALGFEHGDSPKITRKWQSSMKIFIEGNPSVSAIRKVERTISEINSMATDGFSVELVSNYELSNCYIFFGTTSEFLKKFPEAEEQMGSNYAIFNVWWYDNVIYNARIFIDTNRTSIAQQESLVIEEITQSLGLGNDSSKYPNSIFYETATDGGFALDYSDMDKDLIQLLYHSDMEIGLGENQIDDLLRNILNNK